MSKIPAPVAVAIAWLLSAASSAPHRPRRVAVGDTRRVTVVGILDETGDPILDETGATVLPDP